MLDTIIPIIMIYQFYLYLCVDFGGQVDLQRCSTLDILEVDFHGAFSKMIEECQVLIAAMIAND